MPVEKKEHSLYTYIRYVRETPEDLEVFRLEMRNLACRPPAKDVVVDLFESHIPISPEINTVVHLVKRFQGSGYNVRIIMNDTVKHTFNSLNFAKIPNVVCYENRDAFQESISNT